MISRLDKLRLFIVFKRSFVCRNQVRTNIVYHTDQSNQPDLVESELFIEHIYIRITKYREILNQPVQLSIVLSLSNSRFRHSPIRVDFVCILLHNLSLGRCVTHTVFVSD